MPLTIWAARLATHSWSQVVRAVRDGVLSLRDHDFSISVGATGDSEDAQKTREKAQRSIYEMAARQCDLLREVLAKDCRMEAINSNVGRQFGQQQQEGYTVNGSMSFQISLK